MPGPEDEIPLSQITRLRLVSSRYAAGTGRRPREKNFEGAGNIRAVRVFCLTGMARTGERGPHFRQTGVACLHGVYSYARSLCRDRIEAEDLVTETYLRAGKMFGRLPPGKHHKWRLYALARAIWLEGSHRQPEIERAAPGPAETWNQPRPPTMRPGSDAVRTAIEVLPAPLREVIVFREFEGLSNQEIACVLACPAGTVASRLDRSRQALRHLLRAPRAQTPARVLKLCNP
jgi:RNA polymerase sigma-70 factor (ECF subfamily)